MAADDAGAGSQGEGGRGDRTGEPAPGRPSRRRADHRFAGDADQQRVADFRESGQFAQQDEIVCGGLAKAETRVDGDALSGDAGVDRASRTLFQESGDFGGDIRIMRVLLHRPRLAAHVHQANRHAGFGRGFDGAGPGQGPGVVDHSGTSRASGPDQLGGTRVHRDDDVDAVEHGL